MALDNDNTFAQAIDLGAFPGSNSLNVKGNVSFTDDRSDFYRINVAALTRFVAALTPKTSDAGLILFDFNGKGIKDAALKLGDDTLDVLQGVRPNQLTNQHFAQVDFAIVRGVEVPYAIA